MSLKKMRPDPELNSGAADAIAAAEAKLAAAQAAQTEALAELALAKTKALRLSSTDMDIVEEDRADPGAGSGSTAPMGIVEEDHTGRGAGSASRDIQCSLFNGCLCD